METHERSEIQKKANEVVGYFQRVKRGDTEIYTLKDDRPEAVLNLVREAHDGGHLLPDDHRYDLVHTILDHIADGGDPHNLEPDIYTHDLFRWSALPGRADFINQALDEFGKPESYDQLLQQAQYLEIAEVAGSVLASLEAMIEAADEMVEAAEA